MSCKTLVSAPSYYKSHQNNKSLIRKIIWIFVKLCQPTVFQVNTIVSSSDAQLPQQIDALKLELGNSRLGSYDLTLEKSTENAQSVKATQEETSYKAAAGNDGKEIDNKNQEEIISYANLSHPLAVLDEHSNTAYCNNVNNLNDCGKHSCDQVGVYLAENYYNFQLKHYFLLVDGREDDR